MKNLIQCIRSEDKIWNARTIEYVGSVLTIWPLRATILVILNVLAISSF
jgi:hypothetical protein